MKKLLIAVFMFFVGTYVFAETLKVEAITPFTTVNPPLMIELKSLDEIQLTYNLRIYPGDVLVGSLTDIKDPKRLKRDARFKFKIKFIIDGDGLQHKVKENNIAKYVPGFKLDKKEVAKTTALSVGNHFVEGLSMGYRAIEGAVGSEAEGHRLSSAVENVYDHSVLSYASKGEEVVINSGDIFGLKIDTYDEN